MKKILTCLLTVFGLAAAYGQGNYGNADVKGDAELTCTSVPAPSLMADTHRCDSMMWALEYRFGMRKPWLKADKPARLPSVVMMRPSKAMAVSPDASRFAVNATYHPQSVFSRRDDFMFYKDYGWGNAVSDILFGW